MTFLYRFAPGVMRLDEHNGQLTRCAFVDDGAPGDAPPASGIIHDTIIQLEEYFAGERREFSLPLAPAYTPFQQAVRSALLAISFGHTARYSDLATQIGKPGAARAIGNALHNNPLHIVVPCHRIVPATGGIGNYAAGPQIKQMLLEHEAKISACP